MSPDILDDGELIDSPHSRADRAASPLEDLERVDSDVFPLEIEGMPGVSYFEDSYLYDGPKLQRSGRSWKTLFTTAPRKGVTTPMPWADSRNCSRSRDARRRSTTY